MEKSVWFVKDIEKTQYTRFFALFDKDKSGTLKVTEMQTVFA
jgi:hypothetical protein